MAHDDRIREEAAAWAVRAGDPAFDDWDGFTVWLESDPAHAAAYDAVASAVADAAEELPAIPVPVNDDVPAPRMPRRRWLGAMVAAAVAVVAGYGAWQMRGSDYAVETAPGETRMIALADGGEVALSGDTRLLLDRDDPRSATLERGQALFTVHHDDARPFTLAVGEDRLVDIGTVFDVKHAGGSVTVAVSEGAVMFNPKRQKVRIDPGHVLTSRAGSDKYSLGEIPAAQVGEWREGRLTFRDEPLKVIAADLSRATGTHFEVVPAASEKRISGSLLVDPVRRDPRSVGPLLDVTVRQAGTGWVIEAR